MGGPISLKLAVFLFFGSLAVINNPFAEVPETTKFPLFLGAQLLALLIAARPSDLGRRLQWPVIILAVLYLVALIRIKPLEGEDTRVMQGLLTVATLLMAAFMANRINLANMRLYIMIALAPACVMLILNFDRLNNYAIRHWFRLGDFSIGAYQGVSFVLGLVGLCALGSIKLGKSRLANLCYGAIFLTAAYYVFHGSARGEAIAFAVGSLLIIAPRLTVLAAPFSWAGLTTLAYAFETPLTMRLRAVIEGNWGMRDYLIQLSVDLLASRPDLLLFGGGFGTFQQHYELAPGFHPHNIILQSLIVGGLPLLAAVAVLFFLPIAKLVAISFQGRLEQDGRFALGLMVFLMVMDLKSGTIVSMWSTMLFAGVFMLAGQERLSRPRLQDRHPKRAGGEVDVRAGVVPVIDGHGIGRRDLAPKPGAVESDGHRDIYQIA